MDVRKHFFPFFSTLNHFILLSLAMALLYFWKHHAWNITLDRKATGCDIQLRFEPKLVLHVEKLNVSTKWFFSWADKEFYWIWHVSSSWNQRNKYHGVTLYSKAFKIDDLKVEIIRNIFQEIFSYTGQFFLKILS